MSVIKTKKLSNTKWKNNKVGVRSSRGQLLLPPTFSAAPTPCSVVLEGSFLCHYLPPAPGHSMDPHHSPSKLAQEPILQVKSEVNRQCHPVRKQLASAQCCLASETPSSPLTITTTVVVTITAFQAGIMLPLCQTALTAL